MDSPKNFYRKKVALPSAGQMRFPWIFGDQKCRIGDRKVKRTVVRPGFSLQR